MLQQKSNMEKHQNDGKLFITNILQVIYHEYRVYPDYFYTFSLWQSDKQKKLIDFVMIDTVILCGGAEVSDWDHTPLAGPKDPHLAETYWQWIEDQLRQSTYVSCWISRWIILLVLFCFMIFRAPYLLVNGHYPVYSVAEHGPTQCLIDRLRPLLHQYHATAYICGHDHNLQVKKSELPVSM
jgi:tartrate-resistant acid phosphatase type 5